jgi:serine/threonine protein kinase
MTLVDGARFGSFELLGRLGAGGMGEVYRARDTKLGRDVALKACPRCSQTTRTGRRASHARRERSPRSITPTLRKSTVSSNRTA